jgi:hypothetical protein
MTDVPAAVDTTKLSPEIQKAIEEKNVAASTELVKISEKSSPNGKAAERPYVMLRALNARGMAVLCGGKLEPATDKPEEGDDTRTDDEKRPGAADYFNYGFDLDVRAKVRASLMSDLEGPEKAIKKAVDSLVANTGMSETDARDFVLAQRKKAGLAVG